MGFPIWCAVLAIGGLCVIAEDKDNDLNRYRTWAGKDECGKRAMLRGHEGECDPLGKHPCCNTGNGWCGNTSKHCEKKDYRTKVPCPAGQYNDFDGCKECPKNYFSTHKDFDCKKCPTGQRTTRTASAGCEYVPCDKPKIEHGSFNNNDNKKLGAGLSDLVVCDPGFTLKDKNVATLRCEKTTAMAKLTAVPECIDIDECADKPCQNGATCNNEVNKYTCSCILGYKGTNCEEDIDECKVGQPCDVNAVCTNNKGSYTCACKDGYTGSGVLCTDIDECEANPCQNGATCINGENQYTCSCKLGYQGTNCETDINECAKNPCKNGAICNDGVNLYTCACKSGYIGKNCESDINECLTNNGGCHADAVCGNTPGSRTCTCKSGFTGTGLKCEENCKKPTIYGSDITPDSATIPSGDSFTVSCLPQYSMIGSKTISCKDGTLSNQPECRDWYKVEDKTECDDKASERQMFKKDGTKVFASPAECAAACRGTSGMFIFGIAQGKAGHCWCQTPSVKQTSCNTKEHNGYNLYRFIDWNRVEEQNECKAYGDYSSMDVGTANSQAECAEKCRNNAVMFIYGRKGSGSEGKCMCEMESNADLKCGRGLQSISSYDLFRFNEDWMVHAEDAECDSTKATNGKTSDLKGTDVRDARACAMMCRGVVEMFIYGGPDKKCWCELESVNGECETMPQTGYTLYKFIVRPYKLYETGKECYSMTYEGVKMTTRECAFRCQHKAEMFTSRPGGTRDCYCKNPRPEICSIQDNGNTNLYIFGVQKGTCGDGVENGNEEGKDCGGDCPVTCPPEEDD